MTAIYNNIVDRKSMFDGGTNCGKGGTTMAAVHSHGETIGGTMFDPAGPLAVQTIYGVTDSTRVIWRASQVSSAIDYQRHVSALSTNL